MHLLQPKAEYARWCWMMFMLSCFAIGHCFERWWYTSAHDILQNPDSVVQLNRQFCNWHPTHPKRSLAKTVFLLAQPIWRPPFVPTGGCTQSVTCFFRRLDFGWHLLRIRSPWKMNEIVWAKTFLSRWWSGKTVAFPISKVGAWRRVVCKRWISTIDYYHRIIYLIYIYRWIDIQIFHEYHRSHLIETRHAFLDLITSMMFLRLEWRVFLGGSWVDSLSGGWTPRDPQLPGARIWGNERHEDVAGCFQGILATPICKHYHNLYFPPW